MFGFHVFFSSVDLEKNAFLGHSTHSHAPLVETKTLCRLNSIGFDIFLSQISHIECGFVSYDHQAL